MAMAYLVFTQVMLHSHQQHHKIYICHKNKQINTWVQFLTVQIVTEEKTHVGPFVI